MQQYDCQVLFRGEDAALRFLPEGPYPCGPGRISWVAIQNSAASQVGSLNLLDLSSGQNVNYPLQGRPGFAFATNREDVFVIGLERKLQLFDTRTGEYSDLCETIDAEVEGTIINDGLAFEGGLIFGAKDLKFSEKKAGLYLWRSSDRRLITLRNDQICSNGKAIIQGRQGLELLDIDSPTKTVVAYPLDVEQGAIGDPRIVVDLRDGDVSPDGMILTPDGESVIIAIYNPADAPFGEARQYSLADGALQCIWRTEASPQVTCPQLIEHEGASKLVLTTAVEHMSAESQTLHKNAGCMFIGKTPFQGLPETPYFTIPN